MQKINSSVEAHCAKSGNLNQVKIYFNLTVQNINSAVHVHCAKSGNLTQVMIFGYVNPFKGDVLFYRPIFN